jgi:hypothetical protein
MGCLSVNNIHFLLHAFSFTGRGPSLRPLKLRTGYQRPHVLFTVLHLRVFKIEANSANIQEQLINAHSHTFRNLSR